MELDNTHGGDRDRRRIRPRRRHGPHARCSGRQKLTLFDLNEERGEAIARDIRRAVCQGGRDRRRLPSKAGLRPCPRGRTGASSVCWSIAPAWRRASAPSRRSAETGELVPHGHGGRASQRRCRINLVGTFRRQRPRRCRHGPGSIRSPRMGGARRDRDDRLRRRPGRPDQGQAAPLLPASKRRRGRGGLTLPMARDLSTSGIRVDDHSCGRACSTRRCFESITEEYRRAAGSQRAPSPRGSASRRGIRQGSSVRSSITTCSTAEIRAPRRAPCACSRNKEAGAGVVRDLLPATPAPDFPVA